MLSGRQGVQEARKGYMYVHLYVHLYVYVRMYVACMSCTLVATACEVVLLPCTP